MLKIQADMREKLIDLMNETTIAEESGENHDYTHKNGYTWEYERTGKHSTEDTH